MQMQDKSLCVHISVMMHGGECDADLLRIESKYPLMFDLNVQGAFGEIIISKSSAFE